jgi:hypothetical protein
VRQFSPDTVILLTTKEMAEKSSFLKKVIEKETKVQEETIEAYDINNVIEVSERIIQKCTNCIVSLNITGGTKIGTLGTFQAFYTAGNPIYYVDTKNNRILQLFPEEESREIPIEISISIEDYLSVYGFKIEDYVKDDGYIFQREELTEFLAQNIEIVKGLNYQLHPYNEKCTLPVKIPLTSHMRNRRFKTLLKHLSSTEVKNNDFLINDYEALKYLKGIWLEEYVYMQAKALNPDDIKLNVVGKWLTKSKHKPQNEFDVLISKGNRLFYISCKTANPNRLEKEEAIGREFLYELDSIGDTALGLFGKRMLASVRPVRDQYVRSRARILKIDIVDGKNILTLRENLRQWLKK